MFPYYYFITTAILIIIITSSTILSSLTLVLFHHNHNAIIWWLNPSDINNLRNTMSIYTVYSSYLILYDEGGPSPPAVINDECNSYNRGPCTATPTWPPMGRLTVSPL